MRQLKIQIIKLKDEFEKGSKANEFNKIPFDDFEINRKEAVNLLFDDSKKESNIKSQKNMKDIINLFEILLETLIKSKIDITGINSIINEVFDTIQCLKSYEFIYIPFLGPSNSGKSTLINGIIGEDILPTKNREWINRVIIIRYSRSDEIIIRKANFNDIKSFKNKFYYLEPDEEIIGKGISQVKSILNSLQNDGFPEKIEDYFYYIYTKIKLFDDLGLNDHQKNI